MHSFVNKRDCLYLGSSSEENAAKINLTKRKVLSQETVCIFLATLHRGQLFTGGCPDARWCFQLCDAAFRATMVQTRPKCCSGSFKDSDDTSDFCSACSFKTALELFSHHLLPAAVRKDIDRVVQHYKTLPLRVFNHQRLSRAARRSRVSPYLRRTREALLQNGFQARVILATNLVV